MAADFMRRKRLLNEKETEGEETFESGVSGMIGNDRECREGGGLRPQI